MTTFHTAALRENLPHVLASVRQILSPAALPESLLLKLDLIVEEVFLNIARHAYPTDQPGPVAIACAPTPTGGVSVEFTDHGTPFDPIAAPPIDLDVPLAQRRIGGMGIVLLKSFTSETRYTRDNNTNRLSFQIPPE